MAEDARLASMVDGDDLIRHRHRQDSGEFLGSQCRQVGRHDSDASTRAPARGRRDTQPRRVIEALAGRIIDNKHAVR
jgi:hypothetical protein